MAENWIECRPDFWIPLGWDCARFPAYEDFDLDLPGFTDVVNLQGYGRPPPWAWGAWFNALNADRALKMDAGLAHTIAMRVYDSKRFTHVVPLWKRQLIEILTELDDIEDQVSTIAWLTETVLAKFIPIPRSVLNVAGALKSALDGAEKVLALAPLSRRTKTEWSSRRREIAAAKRGARTKLAQLIVWFRDNWGNLLEAGQATSTWFDMGIVLGPIMGFIQDGVWTAAQKTLDNYLIAADALMPGIREAYHEELSLYAEAIDDRWAELYEGAVDFGADAFELVYDYWGEPTLQPAGGP